MEYFTKSFAFLYWVMYLLDLLKIFTRTPEEGSTNTEDEDDVFQECTESTPVETQNVDVSQQTDDETQTVDASQQTEETFEDQKHKAREEELLQEIFALQNELQTAHRVSGESKRKADKLAWDLGMFESRYQLETVELARKRSDEIIQKEIEIMNLQDEYDNRLADLELANTNLMQRILELEMEQASRPQHDPVCDKRSGELEKSVTKIESIQEHLTSLDVITEHAKWTINHVLEEVKEELTSVANESSQPDYDKVRLIKDTQAVKSEMEKVKLELEDAKEQLVKDTLTIKAELVSVKLELVGAKETIVDMEQRQVRLIAAESQLKTIVDGKDVLLASKETELEELRGSLEQAQRKSQVKTRDVECDTDDLPQPVKPKGNDVGCCTDEFPQLVKPEVKDVLCETEDLPTLLKAKKDTACGTDDLPPIPAVKEVQAASADEGKQASDERLTEFSEVVSKKKRAKAKAEAAAESESIYETVMEALSPSQFPALSGKRTARQPSVDVKPVRPAPVDARPARQPASEVKPPVVFPSADVRYKQKPIEGYTVNPSEGKQQPSARPQADAAPKAAPAEGHVLAPSASKPAPSFTIVSREIKQLESEEKFVLVDIHQSHYGRVVGRGGENVRRLQETHGVALSFAQNKKTLEYYDLKITGGSAAKRRAAAREIIDAVPVTIECSNVDLRQLRHPKFRGSEGDFFVKIQRPTTRDEKLKFTGRIKDCRMAFDLLVNGTVTRPSPK